MSDNLKPKCKLTGIDGNVFVIIGTVSKTLRNAGLRDKLCLKTLLLLYSRKVTMLF